MFLLVDLNQLTNQLFMSLSIILFLMDSLFSTQTLIQVCHRSLVLGAVCQQISSIDDPNTAAPEENDFQNKCSCFIINEKTMRSELDRAAVCSLQWIRRDKVSSNCKHSLSHEVFSVMFLPPSLHVFTPGAQQAVSLRLLH